MQVGKFVELIQTELSGGNITKDSRKKYHPAIIKERVGVIYDKLVVLVYQSMRLRKDWMLLDKLTVSYPNISIVREDNEIYCDLPETVDYNNILHIFVSPAKNRDIAFQYVTAQQLSVYKDSFVGMVDTGVNMYYREGYTIKFYKNMVDVDKVNINLVPSFSAYGMDDDAPMIQYMQEDLFTSTINSLRGQQAFPVDLKTDSKPQSNEPARR